MIDVDERRAAEEVDRRRLAAADLDIDTELTVDYRHLLAPGQEEEFRDSASGERIVGFSWAESLGTSTRALAGLIA